MSRQTEIINAIQADLGNTKAVTVVITSHETDHRAWVNWAESTEQLKLFLAPHHGKNQNEHYKMFLAWKKAVAKAPHKDINKNNLFTRPARVPSLPLAAQFALLLIPKRNREHLIGDLEEEYRTIVLPEHGPVAARFWYCWQAGIAILHCLWPVLKRLIGLATIWKLIGR